VTLWAVAAVALAVVFATGTAAAADKKPPPLPPLDVEMPDDFPRTAVGRVNNRVGGFCTGTLVDDRVVLTAAHCLWNPRTRSWAPPNALHFLAGYERGRSADDAPVVRYFIPERRRETGERGGPHLDWALLTLARDIGGRLPTIPLEDARRRLPVAAGAGLPVVQAAYRQDRAHALSIEGRCGLFRAAASDVLLTHDCAGTHGASGAPLLARTPGGYRVVAIAIAIAQHDGKRIGIAIPAGTIDLSEAN